jgi:hypothetical protein
LPCVVVNGGEVAQRWRCPSSFSAGSLIPVFLT